MHKRISAHFRAPKRSRGAKIGFKLLIDVLPDLGFREGFSVVWRTFVHLLLGIRD